MSSSSTSHTSLASVNELLSSWRDALSLTPAELRPILIACTVTSANCPKLLVPLVQQAIADIATGSLHVPQVKDSSTSTISTTSSKAEDSKDFDPTFDDQVRFIRRLREALYKGSVLCGGPYGINALGAVNYALDPELSAVVNGYGPLRGPSNTASPEEYYERGRALFQTIYQHHSKS
ncbi:hypothetical protein BGX34_007278 [Mortierella sp. NVP85]|nr:hypothetical protein BGX34_007278 [Mortierella sp. NVP85]